MKRILLMFLLFLLLGAGVTLLVRTALHTRHLANHEIEPAHTLAEHATSPALSPAPPATHTINSICAICGDPVDATIPAILYHEHLIGFGCKACPALFRGAPDLYGPAAIANQVVTK